MNGLGSYTFLPWVRVGVATEITRVDGSGVPATHPQVAFTLNIDAAGDPRSTTVTQALYGPGEVAGVDPRYIIRRDPAPGVNDAEPNYFPAVEFHDPYFPWLATPARATAQDRLRPWLVLIVLTTTEIKDERPPGTDPETGPVLGQITVPSTDILPNLAQSWAWAHAQISGLGEGESVQSIVRQQSERTLSRLMCPRKLQPHMPYTAFLVPAFERGRLRGLREPIPDTDTTIIDGLASAWTTGQNDIRLPVYAKWQFATGQRGDFEFLVRKLKARQLTGLGIRGIDVSEPDPELLPAAENPLDMEGALASIDTAAAEWPNDQRLLFLNGDDPTNGLTHALNRPQDLLNGSETDPVIAPPLYGRWHAKQQRLRPDQPPAWFTTVNEDPRHRVTASLGTRVVQQQQEQLMASAWEQVEDILSVNEELCQTQVGRELVDQVRVKYLNALDDDEVISVTTPAHRRMRASPTTIYALCRQARISYFGLGAFRRVTRARGSIARRLAQISHVPKNLLKRANAGDIKPAPPPVTADDLITRRKLGESGVGTSTTSALRAFTAVPWLLFLLAILLLFLVLIASPAPGVMAGTLVVAAGLLAFGVVLRRRIRRRQGAEGFRDGTLSKTDVEAITPVSGFSPTASVLGSNLPPEPTAAASDPAGVAIFQAEMAELAAQAFFVPQSEPTPVPLAMSEIRNTLMTNFNPRINHVAAINERLKVADWTGWRPRDPLDKVGVAPEFAQPMYEPLRDLSQEWLLPGIGKIPENTSGLLVTNQAFIEAYMGGINHELARELLWREYPIIDQRGTYSRQFWDVRGHNVSIGDRESFYDIDRIHTWANNTLGANSSRPTPPGGEHLVLIIKGEVLKRYPTTLVYAVDAVRDAEGKLTFGETEFHPVFGGTLQPDVSFFGFELTAVEVQGQDDSDIDLGKFFVLEQQPTEPRFGLDVADVTNAGAQLGASWDDFSWGHLVNNLEDIKTFNYIDLTSVKPDTRFTGASEAEWHADAGSDAAQIAYITLQKPFRVGLHGKSMVPETP